MESILRGIQSSRPNPTPVLYGGALQGNYDEYFKPSPFHNADDVPPPPKNLFSEYGATFEVDKRPFMSPQPQVPRDPELEALNEYFNKQRVLSYARGFSAQIISETIAKQGEQVANSFVKDEIDRRAGIRKNVLVNAGVSEADADRQIAGETLAGINTRTMDMRDKQITDAVNLYYNINNIPPPATQPQAVPNRATIPTGAQGAIPLEEADVPPADTEEMEAEQEDDFAEMRDTLDQMDTTIAAGGAGVPTASGGAASGGFPQEEDFGSPNDPGGWGDVAVPRYVADPEAGTEVGGDIFATMTREQLVNYLLERNISVVGITARANGQMYTRTTMSRINVDALRQVARSYSQGGRGAARVAAEGFANPSF